MAKPRKHVLVCVQGRPPGHPGSCQEKGCNEVYQKFSGEFQNRNLWASGYLLTNTGCWGLVIWVPRFSSIPRASCTPASSPRMWRS